jgi:hypothetical protein
MDRINYGLDEQKAATQTFIRRWRLEPSNPAAYARGEVVDPVKPITYYVDPATPERYVEAVRRGVENWQAAFETAGFSNAIVALDPPSVEEDPDWDAEDVRYSVVRWSASTTRNAQGPSTSDPRTGEIIESDIVWYHNHLRSYRNWMMVQTGAANPDARQLPLTDRLMDEAMEQVITHEIGHAIGLPHNMVASSSYPVDSLRSQSFASRMGVAPTIMDYARQNYIAQPEDGLLPGDDPVRASEYGMANLKRIVPNLVEWTTKAGEDYSDLAEIYGEAVGQWNRYVGHVLTVVAGVHVDLKTSDQSGAVFDGVERDQQKRAMDWLTREVFTAPTWLNEPEILERLGPNSGGFANISRRQAQILDRLVDPRRMATLSELEVTQSEGAYPLAEFLDDVRDAVWGDLRATSAIDGYRRALQRAYLERLEYVMTEEPASNPRQGAAPDISNSDIRPLVRAQLTELRTEVEQAARRIQHRVSEAHLMDVVSRIDAILEGGKGA